MVICALGGVEVSGERVVWLHRLREHEQQTERTRLDGESMTHLASSLLQFLDRSKQEPASHFVLLLEIIHSQGGCGGEAEELV